MEGVNSGAREEGKEAVLVYVEGLTVGFMAIPMLHAWNSYGLIDTRAVDWTMYVGCEWNRYIGIPFTEEEYAELQAIVFPRRRRRPISLFDGKIYPLVEERIQQLLADRKRPAPGD